MMHIVEGGIYSINYHSIGCISLNNAYWNRMVIILKIDRSFHNILQIKRLIVK
jgi:hypothetical protein